MESSQITKIQEEVVSKPASSEELEDKLILELEPELKITISDMSLKSFGLPIRSLSQSHQQQSDSFQALPSLKRLKTEFTHEQNYSQDQAYERHTAINSLNSFIKKLDKSYNQTKSKYTNQQSHLSRGISLVDDNNQLYQKIQFSSFLAWFLLIINAINNAIVPCWMTVDINCEGMTRSAWRIFVLSILLIPFVMFEQRNGNKKQEKFIFLLNRDNLQRVFICSINYCIWALFGVMATKLTARSHSFCFLRLKFFFISIIKFARKEIYHQAQMGGVFLVSIGILMALWDSYSLPQIKIDQVYYLSNSWFQRLFGDLISICGSLAILYLDTHYQIPKVPRFSNLFLYNIFIALNLVTFGYFFGGNQFSFSPTIGVMGLFTQQNFVSIFYVSIMLGINLMIGNLLVDQLFSDFIRNVASCFQIIITTAIYHIFSIEVIYSGMTPLGFSFLIPGMMLIIGGQNYLQKKQFRINFHIYKEQDRAEEKQLMRSSKILQFLLQNKDELINQENSQLIDEHQSLYEAGSGSKTKKQ